MPSGKGVTEVLVKLGDGSVVTIAAEPSAGLQAVYFDVAAAIAAGIQMGSSTPAGITVYGINAPNSPQFACKGGVIVFQVEGVMANRVAKELSERGGIGVRSGCHCAHLLIKHLLDVPPWLEQFQGAMLTLLPRVSLPGLTRVSLGIENSAEEIDTLHLVLRHIATHSRSGSDGDVQRQMADFAAAAAQRVYAAAREDAATPSVTRGAKSA